MSRFSTHVSPPAEEYCLDDFQMLQAKIGKTIGSDGRIKNPWAYDPCNAQSCYEYAQKLGMVGDYLFKKKMALDEKHINYLQDFEHHLLELRDRL